MICFERSLSGPWAASSDSTSRERREPATVSRCNFVRWFALLCSRRDCMLTRSVCVCLFLPSFPSHRLSSMIFLTLRVHIVGTTMAQAARILRARRHLEECLQSVRHQVCRIRRLALPRCVQASRSADEGEDGGDARHLANR